MLRVRNSKSTKNGGSFPISSPQSELSTQVSWYHPRIVCRSALGDSQGKDTHFIDVEAEAWKGSGTIEATQLKSGKIGI